MNVHLPGGTNQTIAQTIGSTPFYYLTDIHGSTVAMTDSNGNVMNTYAYEPYGKQLNSTGTTQNAIKYSNGYQDNSTGLYKFGARYYNTSEGRWTQLDPSGQSVQYVYAANDPINNADPSGLASGGGTVSGCLFVFCGSVTYTGHLSIGVGPGAGVGYNAGAVSSSANSSSGFSDVASCDLGSIGFGDSISSSGSVGIQGGVNNIPLETPCSVQLTYTF